MKLKAIISNGELIWESPPSLVAELSKLEGIEVDVEIKKVVKGRTNLQNRSLHKWFSLLAVALNESGQDMRKTIRKDVDISWTEYNIKEYLFRPMMKAMYGKKSTTELSTAEISKVYELVYKTIAERCGVSIPWPCIDSLIEHNL